MALGSPSSLAGLFYLAGRLACAIVIAWFAVFALDQTGAASEHQQAEVSRSSSAQSAAAAHRTSHTTDARRALDDAAQTITAPFAGLVSGSQSQWTIHIVKTVLALLVYGVALGYLVRFIRVRS